MASLPVRHDGWLYRRRLTLKLFKKLELSVCCVVEILGLANRSIHLYRAMSLSRFSLTIQPLLSLPRLYCLRLPSMYRWLRPLSWKIHHACINYSI